MRIELDGTKLATLEMLDGTMLDTLKILDGTK